MTVTFKPKGYKPTKKEQADNNIDTLDRKIAKAIDFLKFGQIDSHQFIHEITVAHSNFKHNQKRIYNLQENENDE